MTHGASLQGQTPSRQGVFSGTNLTVRIQRAAGSGHVIRLGSELPDVDSNERGKKAFQKLHSIALNGKWKVIFLQFSSDSKTYFIVVCDKAKIIMK